MRHGQRSQLYAIRPARGVQTRSLGALEPSINGRNESILLDLSVNKSYAKAVDFETGGRSDFIVAADRDFNVQNETFSPDSNASPPAVNRSSIWNVGL